MKFTVSICLPTRDSARFLRQRLDSIRNQTFEDWELVAVDSNSTDGTLEILEAFAATDSRVRLITGAPRDGIYPNFNRAIAECRGLYVHIATSDDTMADDCLGKLVAALEKNPDCDLAHCPMKVIDEEGGDGNDWWSGNSLFARSSGGLIGIPHRRIAPLDGILCMLGDNIYSSVTQLLVRRSLYDRIGLYRSDWGSVGDFHWNMRAALAASTVHVPDTWGGWRMHPTQATAAVRLGSAEHRRLIDAMIDDALGGAACTPEIQRFARKAASLRSYLREHQDCGTAPRRMAYVLGRAFSGFIPAWIHLGSALVGRDRWPSAAPRWVGSWFPSGVMVPLNPPTVG